MLQFGNVFDLEADGEHTPSAGKVLAGHFFYPDTGSGHDGGNIQQQAVTGDAVQLQSGFKGLLILGGPADPDPAGCLPGIIPVGGFPLKC